MNPYEYLYAGYCFHLIPTYYLKGADSFSIPTEFPLPKAVREWCKEQTEPYALYETAIHSFYGYLSLEEDACVVLGPVFEMPYQSAQFHFYSTFFSEPLSPQYNLRSVLAGIPQYSLKRLHALLNQICLAMKGCTMPADELLLRGTMQFTEDVSNTLDNEEYNNLWESARIYLPLVKNGNIEDMIRMSHETHRFFFGWYSEDPRENELVTTIISIVLTLNAALSGGLDEAKAYSIAEMYIRSSLASKSVEEIHVLGMKASFQFAKEVRKQTDRELMHTSVYHVIQYIRTHLYTPLSVAELAKYAGYSPAYFSKYFARETGFQASAFITNCKLYEGRSLLATTSKSIGEISNLLCFSDQSHFQKQFKKKFNITPTQYRKEVRTASIMEP